MATTKAERSKNLALVWNPRIEASQEYYKRWADKFQVAELEEAYYGFQWDQFKNEANEYKPYVMNMIFSSIDIKMPNLLFKRPVYTIKPRPAKYDFDPNTSITRARLKQDALNYFAQGGIPNFAKEIETAILDAFFRFGVIEVGYSADYIQNPDADKPFLITDKTPLTDKDGKVVTQPAVLTQEEALYVRRIPAERFRVGGTDHQILSRCSWYAYFDYIRKEDLLAAARTNKAYNTEAIKALGDRTPDTFSWQSGNEFNLNDNNMYEDDTDVVGVWKVYDMRAKQHYLFDYAVSDLLYSESLPRIQHFPIKFRNTLSGFYPMPPVFNWVSPQSEVNETREAARIHRRRFMRKFVYKEGAFDEEELDKLINGGDGTFAGTPQDPASVVQALQAPNLTGQHDQAVITSKDDFNVISGTSSEMRGQADRTTATQAGIIENRAAIRESRDKEIIAEWLSEIGKEIVLIAKESLVLPFWVKLSSDGPGLFSEAASVEENFQLITSDDFGDEDFEVTIQVSSLSPIDQQVEKNKLVEFLTIITQFPQVTVSPQLVYTVADLVGFRNERAIAEVVQMSHLLQTLQIAQLANQTGVDPQVLLLETFMRNNKPEDQNPVAQRKMGQMTPPDQISIQNQIANQLSQPEE